MCRSAWLLLRPLTALLWFSFSTFPFKRSTWCPLTFIATVARFSIFALATYKFKFAPSELSRLQTSTSASLSLATSLTRNGHQQGYPRVSHERFTFYPPDLHDDFPFQYRVNQYMPSLPVVPPHIRFLYVGLTLYYRLPSSACYLPDSAESLAFPLNAQSVDFHHINKRALLAITTKTPLMHQSPTGLSILAQD